MSIIIHSTFYNATLVPAAVVLGNLIIARPEIFVGGFCLVDFSRSIISISKNEWIFVGNTGSTVQHEILGKSYEELFTTRAQTSNECRSQSGVGERRICMKQD